jgi:hypothetical protein
MRRFVFAGLLLCVIAGCTTAAAIPSSPADKRNMITTEEIAEVRAPGPYAWDLISRLRPHFLKSQSPTYLDNRDPVYARVYVDDVYHGELESLKMMEIGPIKSIQFIPPYDTTARFGETFQGGAIMIRTH